MPNPTATEARCRCPSVEAGSEEALECEKGEKEVDAEAPGRDGRGADGGCCQYLMTACELFIEAEYYGIVGTATQCWCQMLST